MADTLLRETAPPVGQPPSPVPQYWNPEANAGQGGYEKVLGKAGAHRVILYDANGNPLLTEANPGVVKISGSFATIRDMVGAAKTATSVASEVFAGASRKPGRRGIWIKNEHPHIRIRVDGPSITSKTGVAVEPFASVIITFDPAVDVPVYVISEAGNAPYGVVEW